MSHDETPAPSATPAFPLGQGPARVALIEHPDPYCRQRQGISLQRDGDERTYELGDHDPRSLVSGLVSSLGGQKALPASRIRLMDDYRHLTTVQWFDVPESVSPDALALRLERYLRGEIPGFLGHVLQQNGYHAAHGAFDALWRAAGQPPIVVGRGAPARFQAITRVAH
jgi:hypothetical protein